MSEYVRIPRDRVGALVGKGGRTKAVIEKRGKVRLDIGQGGDVNIASPAEDGLAEWRARDVVKAVGRGFNPSHAVRLLKEDYVLSIINLDELFRGRDSEVRRVKSRLIGEKGKAWRTLEKLTDTKMAVYGKTVAIIGCEEDVELMEKGIRMLISGSRHPNVYRFLERERRGRRIGL